MAGRLVPEFEHTSLELRVGTAVINGVDILKKMGNIDR
jgi:hypothetical protein